MSDIGNAIFKISAETSGISEAKRSIDSLGDSSKTAGQSFAQVGQGGAASAKSVQRATDSMVRSIQRQIAAAEAGSTTNSKYFSTIAQFKGADTKALEPLLKQLDAASPALDKVGLSAKQTAFALRGVPAQFTDIVTSLQGGQKPLTVLLQQGGQLKDMFGGVGNAAKALGGYVLGLVNPYTIAAAAVGTLAYAYYKGSQEYDGYVKALVLTGNAAGTTAAKLSLIASSISASGNTKSAAADALTQIATAGNIASDNLEKFSKTALNVKKTVGQSIGDTAKVFAELGNAPTATSEKLNQQYHYLTASVYAQIKALEEQGKVEQAASLAQNAFADAMDVRTKKIIANQGLIEDVWNSVVEKSKKAWDSILDVGRKDTDGGRLTKVNEQIAQEQQSIANLKKPGSYADAGDSIAYHSRKLVQLKEEQATLTKSVDAEEKNAAAVAASGKQEAARIQFIKDGDKYLSKYAQTELEVNKVREQGKQGRVSQIEIEQRINAIRQKSSGLNASALIDKSISSYQSLADAARSAFESSLQSEKDYIKESKTLKAQAAAAKPKDLSLEGQAFNQLDVSIAKLKLGRLAATSGTSYDDIKAQAELVRTLAANLTDQARAQDAVSESYAVQGKAADKAGMEQKTQSDGLREQWEKAQKTVTDLQAAKESLGKPTAINIESQTAQLALDAVREKLAGITDKTVTLTVVQKNGIGNIKPDEKVANLPSFDVGTNFVPHDMVAKIHKGERIVTAAENAKGGNVVPINLNIPGMGSYPVQASPDVAAEMQIAIRRAALKYGNSR